METLITDYCFEQKSKFFKNHFKWNSFSLQIIECEMLNIETNFFRHFLKNVANKKFNLY